MKRNILHNAEFFQNNKNITQTFRFEKVNANPCIPYIEQQSAYYESLVENNTWIKEIMRICHTQFEGIYIEYKSDTYVSVLQGVSLNYLIHKDFLLEFNARSHDLRTNLKELQFLCSGPRPPYHFVSSGNCT